MEQDVAATGAAGDAVADLSRARQFILNGSHDRIARDLFLLLREARFFPARVVDAVSGEKQRALGLVGCLAGGGFGQRSLGIVFAGPEIDINLQLVALRSCIEISSAG